MAAHSYMLCTEVGAGTVEGGAGRVEGGKRENEDAFKHKQSAIITTLTVLREYAITVVEAMVGLMH